MLPLTLLLAVLPTTYAYSFNFTSVPAQCQDLSLSIAGAGKPPYSVLIIPFGPSPLPNNVEARTIFQVQFNDSSTSFQLKYPADSEFVAVVSDSTGFGTGGTSVAATVLSSSTVSCFNATATVMPDFVFSIVPNNQLVQCTPTRIWWDPSTVQGTPQFQGVIPGGQSFAIPESALTTVANEGLGFSWTPNVRTGTTVLLLGGDNRGPGTGGSGFYIMSQGTSGCLNSTSPSSTPGSPAGGSYPTSTSGASTGGTSSGGSHTNVGGIVGGVIGGIAGLVLVLAALWFFRRRQQTQQTQKERPVDLLQDHDHDTDDGALPQYYQPEPFLLPEPTVLSSGSAFGDDPGASTAGLRPSLDTRQQRLSQTTLSMSDAVLLGLRAPTPDASTSLSASTRKSPHPPTLRPVNIIQHDDAGPPPSQPTEEQEQEPETIELPPAYTHIRRGGPPPPPEPTD